MTESTHRSIVPKLLYTVVTTLTNIAKVYHILRSVKDELSGRIILFIKGVNGLEEYPTTEKGATPYNAGS